MYVFAKVFVITFVVVTLAGGGLSWRRRRRRRSPPPCRAQNCVVSAWTVYSGCSHQCGSAGSQAKTRRKTRGETCGGTCPYHFRETRACNRNACRNGGVPQVGRCSCKAGYTGTCCEHDVNECATQRPCQHRCTNTYGSYTCQCNPCYTKLGTRCDLRQCLIGGRCYPYNRVNPGNPCQNCQSRNKLGWTNNNALRCNDGNACTRADHCSNGRCVGTPFTCLPCETCAADTCRVKPGYCVITVNGKKTCFNNRALRPGYPCQQCDSSHPTQWTNNNALPCNDGNLKTKSDRCSNGACKGTPYSCLPCERHDGSGCRLNAGNCIIQHGGTRTCFANQQLKPGNPCQWCSPSASTSVWTNRNGVSCNDGNLCTRADTCRNGMCTSTPFNCNSHCQVCNGNSCSQKPGFGFVAGKCTCKISGKDYNHQVINPANQCQWCNLYDASTKPSGAWTNRPTVLCDDRNLCTKQDKCNSGRCVGVGYSCLSSFPSTSCIRTSVCIGDGRCRHIYRALGTICRAAKDGCDKPEKCNGRLGDCPASVTDAITLKTGSVELKNSLFASAVAFQSITNALYLGIHGFTISCGQMKYKWYLLDGGASCSTSSSTKGLLSNTNAKQTISGLTLLDNRRYKVALQAVDMRSATRPIVCSSPVAIDTTRPTGGWVRDGTAADVSYQSTKLISANWGGFSTRHGVGRYEWKVLYTPYGRSTTSVLLSYTSVALNTRASKTFNGIIDGSTVKVQVRVYTKAGLYIERMSNGVVVDTSRPTAGSIYDGAQAGRDLRFAKWTNTYSANWNAFIDPHSGILKYQWAIKLAGSSLITAYKNTALSRSDTFTGLNLVSGQSYCAVIRGYNKAGVYVEGTSNCVLIDHDKPRAGTVNDGTGSDVQHQSNGTVISANWNGFSDGAQGSGLAGYQYRITNSRSAQIVGWTSVGMRTSMRHSGLALINGMKYFVTVRALDAVGWTTDVTSNGVIVDTSRPVFTGTVKVTGLSGVLNGKPCIYATSAYALQVSWVGFTDGHSGLDHYSWAVIPSARPVTNSDFKRVGPGLPTKASFSGLTLTPGSSYFVVIRAVNRAFLYTDASSVVVIPDPSPPQPGQVSDGPTRNLDIDYQTSLDFVKATWTPFPESHTRVKQYYYAIGSCIQGNYHVTGNKFLPVSPPTAILVVHQNIKLVNGQKYCTKVKATNMAGLYSKEVTSDGFIADITPPDTRNARVIDGRSGTDIDYQHSLSEMSATWEGITDPESGIKNYEYGISRNRGGAPDVLAYRSVNLSTTARATGLRLAEEVYYFIVCAVNKAGLRKCLSSDGVLIDHSPPQKGVVNDGTLEPDVKYQSSLLSIAANWDGIWDLESGIETFEWAVKENATNRIVMDFTDVGLATHVRSERPLQLVNGKTYMVHLRYKNTAGAVQEILSNGVTVDSTAPHPSTILPGPVSGGNWKYKASERTYYTSGFSQISAHWNSFVESESEVWFYKWAIGTSKCGAQVQPLTNIGSLTTANTTMSDQTFKYGTKYYVTVTSRNRANLVSRSCSDAFVFDKTPPRTGDVYVGIGDRHQTYIRGDAITVRWRNFVDRESGTDYCDVFLDSVSSRKIATVPDASSGLVNVPKNRVNPSQSHRVAVQCYNKAGLSSLAWSQSFVIDNSPPVSAGGILVGISRDRSRQYQASTDSVTITWNPFTDPESPLVAYWVSMGTRELIDDVVRIQNVGLATEVVRSDLKLFHKRLYYVTVTACNAGGLNTSVPALPLLVDITPPQGDRESVKDGENGNDIDYISLNETVAAHWEDISDPESGIIKSRYCLGTKPLGCQLKGPTDVGVASRFTCPSCKTNPGDTIYVTVEATNGAGRTITRTSNGMLVDGTPPFIGDVIDGNSPDGIDMRTALRGWNISATLGGVEDKESGIDWCKWKVVDERDQDVVSVNLTGPFKLEGKKMLSSEKTYASLNVPRGIYYNVIICENKAKLRSTTRSNGFRVVSEWPGPATVRDGLSDIDLDFITSSKLIDANWDKFHADSRDPVVEYAWAVGTSAGQEDVSKFQSVGLNTRVEKMLSSEDDDFDVLTPGQKYYITVKATAASGLSSIKSSDGFIVDITPPIKSEVRVTFRVSDQRRKNIEVNIGWSGVKDIESGILESQYCITTTSGSCKSNTVYSAGNATSAVIPNFHPVSLTSYYVTVIVQNKALLATVMTSDKFIIDTSPPSKGHVIDGYNRDIDFANDTSVIASQWRGIEDKESGIKNCTWSLIEQSVSSDRASFGNDSVVFEQSVGSAERITRSGLSLRPGSRYINRISCENKDGFISKSDSDGVIIDISPPVVGNVTEGNDFTKDIDFVSMGTTVEAVWREFSDPESGIVGYRWALGTSPGKDDVIAFLDVRRNTKATAKNVTLTPGGHYYVTVEATNGAGMTAEGWSDGFIVEDSPPEILQLSNGGQRWLGPSGRLSATWQSRDLQSGIAKTEYCVGTSVAGCQTQPMRELDANANAVTCRDCYLKELVTYYMTVRVWNAAGLYTTETSEGVSVDLTPPTAGNVTPDDDVTSCVTDCTLTTTVKEFIDHQSGINSCRFAIRNNTDFVTAFVDFIPGTAARATGLTLVPGQRYFTVVSCADNAGLTAQVTSKSGVLVDITPPTKGRVIVSPDRTHDVYGIHSSCHLYNSKIRLHWYGFQDRESGITGFRVAMGTTTNTTNVLPFTDIGIATSYEVNATSNVYSGDIVYAMVEARNGAGLVTRAITPPTRLVSADKAEYLVEGDFTCLNF